MIPRLTCTISGAPPPPPGLLKGPPPERRLSDSLTKLIEPYTSWPPLESELDQFFSDLCFGADVWNATLTAPDPVACHRELDRIVSVHFEPKNRSDALIIAKKISERKKKLFGKDNRLIVDVRIVDEGEQPIVYAAGVSWC